MHVDIPRGQQNCILLPYIAAQCQRWWFSLEGGLVFGDRGLGVLVELWPQAAKSITSLA